VYDFPRIEAWVIVFFIAILFGLSMDYEIFIVSRIREAWLKGRTNDEAIVEGIAHTGGVVTSAAFILIGAMSGFIWGHFVGLQQLGLGLALGILIDASIIRLFLLPSVMALLGKWNWQSRN
jgi:RND superfamily putative drug exporter